MKNKEKFACDVLILSTSSLTGKCYVMTANLDGESNLKPKMAVKETRKLMNISFLKSISGEVECQSPNPDLFSFSGRLDLVKDHGVEKCGVGVDNLALRGTQLRNTDYILGVAVYTGEDTKMSQNSKITANKFSSIERTLNLCFISYLGLLLFEVGLCLVLEFLFSIDLKFVEHISGDDHWYLGDPPSYEDKVSILLNDGVSYLILFSYIIPASLYVTLEISRVFNSMFIIWDKDLTNNITREAAMVNSSDLNEEVGQINILFSDKTGTLTENVMVFKAASIAGSMYSLEDLKIKRRAYCSVADLSRSGYDEVDGVRSSQFSERQERKIHQFLMALCLCHSGQVNPKEDVKDKELFYGCSNESFVTDEDDVDGLGESLAKFEYNAPSPDEKAILEGCSYLGMKFAGEDEVKCNCKVLDTRSQTTSVKSYKKLHTLEFDSVRRRMSVIVKHPNGKIYLISKGADSSVMPRCVTGPVTETGQHVDECSLSGLRTLVLGMREVSEQELVMFERSLQQALISVDSREERVRSVVERLETGLVLLGATAVEDRLQDGVEDTLTSLSEAGVSVWILTGDKKETAVNISFSSGHLHPGMTLLDLTDLTSISALTSRLNTLSDQILQYPRDQFAMIVSGDNISVISSNNKLNVIFVKVRKLSIIRNYYAR